METGQTSLRVLWDAFLIKPIESYLYPIKVVTDSSFRMPWS